MVHWAHASHPPNRISMGSAVFAGFIKLTVTYRQTETHTHTHTHTRPHYSVCSSSQHLAIAAIIIIKLLRFLSFLYHATHSTTCASRHVCLSVRLSVCHARCIVWKRLNQAVNAGWIS